ncbi:uncharacterized protein TM35_000191490 [Trypanosoma theileri]|uniref:Uncharacterized protein n=1 Tax=Trypanosoma theileri TaxID=67003 RepID=A0A1X0NT78_9TRYP|nr:uncharacterized protein TM35_000191490 [Trypanosoma theileri]ORC87905.1 hypothetical protein TM35_000191490 [Trypanosoma theileri]
MSNRRESAHAFVQRLRATPVSLSPQIFHNATDGGLRQSDVLIVGGPPGSGKTTWVYRVAAQHVNNGGLVTFLFLPGSGNFVLRRFMEQLEMLTPLSLTTEDMRNNDSMDNNNNSDGIRTTCTSDIETRRQALLNALHRVEVVHCADITDLAVYCMHEKKSELDSLRSDTAVPLVIAEGCGGKGSYLHHMERAMGHESPLCYWFFNCLQRRRRCALILVEEWGFTGVEREDSSFTTIVETESELLRRLQKETYRMTMIPKSYTNKRQRMSSTSNVISHPVSEASSHFVGNLRLFYLHIQSIPTTTVTITTTTTTAAAGGGGGGGGFVTVARLLQWRLMQKQETTSVKNEISEVLTESSRPQRWRHSIVEKPTPFCGELLCAAQL